MNEKMKCENCRFLGVQSHATGLEIDQVPVCRRNAPSVNAGSGTGYSGELFPAVEPASDWCGEFEPADARIGPTGGPLGDLMKIIGKKVADETNQKILKSIAFESVDGTEVDITDQVRGVSFIRPEKSMLNPDNWTDEMRDDVVADWFEKYKGTKNAHIGTERFPYVIDLDDMLGVPLVFAAESVFLGTTVKAWKTYGENDLQVDIDSETPNEVNWTAVASVINKVLFAEKTEREKRKSVGQ